VDDAHLLERYVLRHNVLFPGGDKIWQREWFSTASDDASAEDLGVKPPLYFFDVLLMKLKIEVMEMDSGDYLGFDDERSEGAHLDKNFEKVLDLG
jgi:hypothetical protein